MKKKKLTERTKRKLISRGEFKFDFKAFSLILLLELCFLATFGLAAFQLLNRVAEDSLFVSDMIKQKSVELQQTGQLFTRDDIFKSLTSNEEFIRAYSNIFNNFILIIITFIILYLAFQSATWWISDRKRLDFWRYFYRFSLISLIWFFIILVISFIYLNAVSNIYSLFIPGILRAVYTILFIVSLFFLSYFLVLCYYFIKEKSLKETIKKTFLVGVIKFNRTFWKFLLLGFGKIGLFVLVLVIYTLSYNILLILILFALLIVPYIAWAKIKIVRMLDNI